MVRYYTPFPRLLLSLLGGILMANFGLVTSLCRAKAAFGCLTGLYILLGFVYKGRYASPSLMGMVGFLALGTAGAIRFLVQDPTLDHCHLIYHADSATGYRGVVIRRDLHEKHGCLVLEVSKIEERGIWRSAKGKVAVWMALAAASRYSYGDCLMIKGVLRELSPLANPYSFDYKQFARQRGLYHESFARSAEITYEGYHPPSRIMAMTYYMRSYLGERLAKGLSPKQQAIALPLVLGIRKRSEKALTMLSVAGIVHVLAVSGMHVGMLYLILLYLCMLLGLARRRSGYFSFCLILLLWGYALITALSPPVLRAVAMLSLSRIAKELGRHYTYWNSFSTSAFFLLFYNPYWFLQLGFQLSYLSMAGIGWLYPKLEMLFVSRRWMVRRLWQSAALSISVQLTTLPLTLYYFHAFPTYFLLGNWIALLVAPLILGLGLLTCLAGGLPWIGALISTGLAYAIDGLYLLTALLERLPYSYISSIWLSVSDVFLGYGAIVSLVLLFTIRKYRYFLLFAAFALALSTLFAIKWSRQWRQKHMIFYKIPGLRAASFILGRRAVLLTDSGLGEDSDRYKRNIAPSLGWMGTRSPIWCHFQEDACKLHGLPLYKVWHGLTVVVWNGRVIVWLGERALIPPRLAKPWEVAILVVEKHAVASIDPWLERLSPGLVILGCSLGGWQKKGVKASLEAKGIPYHDLMKEGGLIPS